MNDIPPYVDDFSTDSIDPFSSDVSHRSATVTAWSDPVRVSDNSTTSRPGDAAVRAFRSSTKKAKCDDQSRLDDDVKTSYDYGVGWICAVAGSIVALLAMFCIWVYLKTRPHSEGGLIKDQPPGGDVQPATDSSGSMFAPAQSEPLS